MTTLDTNLLDASVAWDASAVDATEVQAVVRDGSWGATVVTYERSNNGQTWAGFATPVTQSAAGFSGSLTLEGIRYLRARVSTAAGAANQIELTPGPDVVEA